MHRLVIAGFEFHLTPPAGVRFTEADPAYRGFWDPDGSVQGDCIIPVEVCRDDPPIDMDQGYLVEISSTWRYWSDGETRAAIFDSGAEKLRKLIAVLLAGPERIRPGPESVRVIVTQVGGGNRAGLQVNPLHLPVDMVLLSMLAAPRGALIIHAAGYVLGGRAAVLAGPGGGGKSTLGRLLQEGGGGTLLSDDRVVLRLGSSGLRAWGTPWAGTGGMAANAAAPVSEILLLEKGDRNTVQRLSDVEAAEALLRVCTVPWYDEELSRAATGTLEAVSRRVPVYRFFFRADASAAAFVRTRLGSG